MPHGDRRHCVKSIRGDVRIDNCGLAAKLGWHIDKSYPLNRVGLRQWSVVSNQ
jgi:hypothetical protein